MASPIISVHIPVKSSNIHISAGIAKETLAGSNASVYIGSFVKGKESVTRTMAYGYANLG